MSGPTVGGAALAQQFTGGAAAALSSFFNSGASFTVFSGSGVSTVSGPVAIGASGTTATLSNAPAVADTSSGGNSITVTSKASIVLSANDALSASGAGSVIQGGSMGVDTVSATGESQSVSGGEGGFIANVTGANDIVTGGSGNTIATVSGANSLAVSGPGPGVTGIDESASTGPETIATNPNGNSGTLVATMGSGADTAIGGSGASTITGGSGDDVFAFIKGHAGGTEVIINFTPSDNLVFSASYGYTATNLPTEAVGSLGDVITLNDGTTITLAGYDHKIF
jgi:Ca2+-binding RTX toxin-like protein